MSTFNNSKWIWVSGETSPDTHAEFFSPFIYNGELSVCSISCDSDYELYINGEFVSSNQYGDYESYKSYDQIDITKYLKKGENTIAVHVWYWGESTMRYISATAGLIFEIVENNQTILVSDENVLSRISKTYLSGNRKIITPQLGFTIFYDATKEDKWKRERQLDFTKSIVVEKNCNFVRRPVLKSDFLQLEIAKEYCFNGKNRVFDLGEEKVGLISFSFYSSEEQDVIVCWGEDLQDGKVRRIIESRDFSFYYHAKKGYNTFTERMLRFGLRYLQFDCQKNVEFIEVGIIPQVYPVVEKQVKIDNKLDKKIYDLCVRTLKLCMMEHYVDCPWREQCLYAFDSRNQMLCGYFAFEGGNTEYAKANLLLMSKDKREDGLLSICFPCGADLTIPSFSLYYIRALYEYLKFTGDYTLIDQVFDKIQTVLKVFCNRVKDGLVEKFDKISQWNFYDWSEFSEGTLGFAEKSKADFMINALVVYALSAFEKICIITNRKYPFAGIKEGIIKRLRKEFYVESNKSYNMNSDDKSFTELVNSFAILLKIATKEQEKEIAEKLASGNYVSCSLSMKVFKYEALLSVDDKKYSETVLNEIRSTYGKMINEGATSVWETEEGASAFNNAGSLCHGWSAIPVYIYNKLGLVENNEN